VWAAWWCAFCNWSAEVIARTRGLSKFLGEKRVCFRLSRMNAESLCVFSTLEPLTDHQFSKTLLRPMRSESHAIGYGCYKAVVSDGRYSGLWWTRPEKDPRSRLWAPMPIVDPGPDIHTARRGVGRSRSGRHQAHSACTLVPRQRFRSL
jgi:hypothetical protein